ncbi:CoA pyrophosphatase [Sphingomicrobium marinum]|uniref:CoA pyrophosphatase n=1 Tax=Sphingomicrobium marinum TaxID=1227950 RepID=UPI0022409961|nr:CoA pyrophosphatase [Sphingomicrobium marinum]
MSLADRLDAALRRDLPDRLGGDDMDAHEMGETIPAAVLVPVIDRPEPTLLLTVRSGDMRNHAGQVAFPGGRIDATDADEDAAALREAKEELGIRASNVQLIGRLDRYRTGTDFCVTPVVGLLPPDLPLIPQPSEVAAVFEAPLEVLTDPARQIEEEVDWKGRRRRYWRIEYEGYKIWGATAGMIVNLTRRLMA